VTPDRLPDAIAVAVMVTGVFDRLGVPYVVGGSFASSVYGEPRSTNDIDVVADLRPRDVRPLVAALGADFYADVDAVSSAVDRSASFNVIHAKTAVKVDVFVAGGDEFDHDRIARRRPIHVDPGSEAVLYVDTAEATVLRKLEWFRRGGESSERQWRDVVSVLRVRRAQVDGQYLRFWADRLGVTDLLDRAEREV
jgi:hypothetical protein